MRILIVGEFMGSRLAQRFSKEGHELIVIDRKFSAQQQAKHDHTHYTLDIADRRCEEVFRLHNIDIVLYMTVGNDSIRDGQAQRETLIGLVHMLEFTRKYNVKKFLYASLAGGLQEAQPAEKAIAGDDGEDGFQALMGETYCLQWKKFYGADLTILRFADVYGPGIESGIIAAMLNQAPDNDALPSIEDTRESWNFIYVDDAVDAVYRLAVRDYASDVINISADADCSAQELVRYLAFAASADGGEKPKANFVGSRIESAMLDNAQLREELGWRAKYSLEEGLRNTWLWHQKQRDAEKQEMQKKKKMELFARLRPYGENLCLFGLMAILTVYGQNGFATESMIGVDYNFIYIAAMGILYGKSQSIPATVLSAGLWMYGLLDRGADFVAVMYQAQHMMHFAAYVFVGVLMGYLTDNRDRAMFDMQVVCNNLEERYQFLERMYLKNVQIKDRLYKQIINSDDSIGRTYKIVNKLDSIELEHLFNAANEIVAEMMDTEQVAIYVVGKNRYYLRQKTRTGEHSASLPRSLKVSALPYLEEMMEDKQIFVNKLLVPGLPDMAAPVLYQGEVIAVIQLYDMTFEELSLYRRNLLKITSMLIADALGKAYLYEEKIQDKKYIAETRILLSEEFAKVKVTLRNRIKDAAEKSTTGLLKIMDENPDYVAIYKSLMPLIREEDFIGVDQAGFIYVLLSNIDREMIAEVQNRIRRAGLIAEDASGDLV